MRDVAVIASADGSTDKDKVPSLPAPAMTGSPWNYRGWIFFFFFFFLVTFFFFFWCGLGGGHPCNCRHFGTLGSSCNMKNVNSHRDRGGRRRHPCNCRYFWTLESSCNLRSANSHRDRGGRRRHPCNCRYFWTLESSCNYEKY